jgi:hypothetical protein
MSSLLLNVDVKEKAKSQNPESAEKTRGDRCGNSLRVLNHASVFSAV